MDLRTATRIEKNRRQAIAISAFLVVLMLGISTTFIALSLAGNKRTEAGWEPNEPVLAPETPVVTASWVLPVETSAATILKAADFDMVQFNKTANWYEFDLGYTIGASEGTSVVACYDGKVTSVVEDGDATTGKLVRIQHANGLETVYSSLDSVTVQVGDDVKGGDKIGTVGNTSYYEVFDMPHVRLMAYKDGKAVNPEQYVEFPNSEDK